MSSLTAESDLHGREKAIRLITGEGAGRTARLHALAKLHAARVRQTPFAHGDRFPDVSNNNGANVDWAAVRHASSVRVGVAAMTKLTEGLHFVDALGAKRLHIMAGERFPHRAAYHFGHPGESGTAQAQHFLTTAHDGGVVWQPSDRVAYDCEVSDGLPARLVALCARDFAAEIRRHFPGRLWLYGGGPFLKANGVTLEGYNGHQLAAYVPSPWPFVIYGRKLTYFWQYTDGVHGPGPHACPGIGNCDMSIVL